MMSNLLLVVLERPPLGINNCKPEGDLFYAVELSQHELMHVEWDYVEYTWSIKT